MKIYPIININTRTNVIKNFRPSFGEYDGDDYSYSYNKNHASESEIAVKKDLINEKYNRMRSSWIRDCEDLEFDNNVMWKRLREIEELRDRELAQINL